MPAVGEEGVQANVLARSWILHQIAHIVNPSRHYGRGQPFHSSAMTVAQYPNHFDLEQLRTALLGIYVPEVPSVNVEPARGCRSVLWESGSARPDTCECT